MKNIHLDLVRATEAGAIAAAEWVGRGDKESADKAATDAMRDRLNKIGFKAEIAIGEGIKDESYGLFEGEIVGTQDGDLKYSIAVDPIEGTTPTVKGGYEAISVIALGEKDSLYKTEHFYMDKIAVGPKVASKRVVDLDKSPASNVNAVAEALGKGIQHVTVCVLDRERTTPLIKELKEIGCRLKFISDCDVTACIAVCEPDSGVDMYWSIGGAPEAIIAACAMKCMGGFLQCREVDDKTFEKVNEKKFLIEDLAAGDVMFSATGITDGKLLKGTRFTKGGPITHSLAMRSPSKTIRRMETQHGN